MDELMYWRTRDREVYYIPHMGDGHLVNTIRFLQRFNNGAGPMGNYKLCTRFINLKSEAQRRGLQI